MAENNRLTEKERNHDGTGISKQSLVVEHGMKKGMPSAYCEAIVTKLADYEDIAPVEECQEAMEKQKAKKPILRKDGAYDCVCGNIVTKTECYCEDCGQKLDWSEEE